MVKEAKYDWKQVGYGFSITYNSFDDIRNVVSYLRIKRKAKIAHIRLLDRLFTELL